MKCLQKGFTLIEIMVVMVILSFGLVAVVAATGQAARSTRAIAELESLRQAAEQVMATELTTERLSRELSEGSLGSVTWVLEATQNNHFCWRQDSSDSKRRATLHHRVPSGKVGR
jgi:prepilin-type N-terminal cleavage/methylation domain-containing protein